MFRLSTALALILTASFATSATAEVKDSAGDGFSLQISSETKLNAADSFRVFVDDFSKWWDASHSYSGDAKNLKIDLDKACFLETLPKGGFVRHMELAYYHPAKRELRFTGGLGPLQAMGVQGAMSVSIQSVTETETTVSVQYNVAGFSSQQLDKIAPVVDQVLTAQIKRFVRRCDKVHASSDAPK